MTTQAQPDFFKTWKELYDRSEELWSKPMQEMLGTESFVAWMSATRESALTQQKMSRESLEATWDAMRLPSKTDIARLAGQVVALENKVDALEDRLDDMQATLDKVLGHMDTLVERLDSVMTIRTATPSVLVETLPAKTKRPAK